MTAGMMQGRNWTCNATHVQVTQVMHLLRTLMSLATVSRHQQTVKQLHNNWVCPTIQLTMMGRLGRVTILHIATLKGINLNSTVGQTQVLVPRVTNVYVWQVASSYCILQKHIIPPSNILIFTCQCTMLVLRMAHRKQKETKQEPGTAEPGNMLGCCLNSFHCLWAILSTSTVYDCL